MVLAWVGGSGCCQLEENESKQYYFLVTRGNTCQRNFLALIELLVSNLQCTYKRTRKEVTLGSQSAGCGKALPDESKKLNNDTNDNKHNILNLRAGMGLN